MRHPQVLVYESDGRLAEYLRRSDKPHAWSIREPRSLESCLHTLRRGGPCVLILKLGQDLVAELTLLDRVSWMFPDTATVVVGDTDNAELAGLAWDLGARFVLFPPLPRQELLAIVTQLLEAAVRVPPQADDTAARAES